MKWKFREVNNTDMAWSNSPSEGIGLISSDAQGYKSIYCTKNPTELTIDMESPTNEIKTVNSESILVDTFKSATNKSLIKYNIKLEYQSENVFNGINFLYRNGKQFYLYNNENIDNPSVKRLWLKINSVSISQIALQGEVQLYTFTLNCTDIESDSTQNPKKYIFQEKTDVLS